MNNKLVIGIGNPGEKYKNNRHNVGVMLVDFLSSKLTSNFILKKSDSFMNDSGVFIRNILKSSNSKPENLYVVHDDLDIPLGQYKIQFAKGPKVHNGISSVEKELGSNEFWRIRIGVDARSLEDRTPGERYVLEDFNASEMEILNKVFNEICSSLKNAK